jgi:hypothetical protein
MDLPPDEKLSRVIRNHIKNIIIKDLSMFSVFFSEDHQLPQKDVKRIRQEKRRYTQIIEDIIQEGIRKGLFVQADPRLQAYGILGMCNWIYTWYRPGKTKYKPEEIADYFVSLLETGYLSRAVAVEGEDPGPRRPKQHKGVGRDRRLEELRSLLKRGQELVDDMGVLPHEE